MSSGVREGARGHEKLEKEVGGHKEVFKGS